MSPHFFSPKEIEITPPNYISCRASTFSFSRHLMSNFYVNSLPSPHLEEFLFLSHQPLFRIPFPIPPSEPVIPNAVLFLTRRSFVPIAPQIYFPSLSVFCESSFVQCLPSRFVSTSLVSCRVRPSFFFQVLSIFPWTRHFFG